MLDALIDLLGDQYALALGGALIGLLFGALAQRSRFCLRAATLEVAHGDFGEKLAIWLFTFATALIATQALILLGLFDTGAVRQLNNRGSLSGALLGGAMFGCGMTLTRACGEPHAGALRHRQFARLAFGSGVRGGGADVARRHAVAAAHRRQQLVDRGRPIARPSRADGPGQRGALLFGCFWLVLGAVIAFRRKVRPLCAIGAIGVGLMVAVAWAFNYAMSTSAFEMVPVHALSFTCAFGRCPDVYLCRRPAPN